MPHEVLEDMVYSFKQPMWHNLVKPSETEKTAVQILEEDFHGGFDIILRPVVVELNGKEQETGDYAIIRSKTANEESEELLFGYCTERYKPLQPREIAETIDDSIKKPIESMGFIFDGKEMFASFKMPSFEVVKDDELQLYGIIKSGFDSLKGTSLFTAIHRPICSNTLNMAASWANENTDGHGRGNIWNSRHVNKNLLRDLGYWASFIMEDAERKSELVESFFRKLVDTPIKKDEEVHEILYEAFPPVAMPSEYMPQELRPSKVETVERKNAKLGEIRDGIYSLFAGAGVAITPDYYGIVNSTTEYFCHKFPSKKEIANSVMWGNRQKMMMQVVDVLNNKIGG